MCLYCFEGLQRPVELKNYSDNNFLRLFLSAGEGLYTSPTVFFYSEFGLDRAGI